MATMNHRFSISFLPLENEPVANIHCYNNIITMYNVKSI